MGECFFWYRPTWVVPDQRLLNGRRRRLVGRQPASDVSHGHKYIFVAAASNVHHVYGYTGLSLD